MSDSTSRPSGLQPTRRDFIRNTSAIAAAGALAGTLGMGSNAHAAGDDTIKIALIGCGGRGSGAVKDAANAAKDAGVKIKLVCMADAFEDRLASSLKTLKGELGDVVDVAKDKQFVGFDAYKQALDSGIDMAFLATPPGFRPIHFEAAINAGKNVFMEKPVATDAAGVRKVLAAAKVAKEKNLAVGVGLQRRHEAGYIDTIKRLHDGAIGDITSMRAYWNGSTPWCHTREELTKKAGRELPEFEYQMRNWYYFTWICGDHIVEQHIHNLDVINWLKDGYPVMARGMGGCQVRKGKDYGETFDHHAVQFEYADGSICYSECRHIPNTWTSVTEHCVGTKGKADISAHKISVAGGEDWKSKAKGKNPYVQEHEDLFKSIVAGKPNNEAERGALSTMTSIFGRMATYSGKQLKWEDALNSSISIMPTAFAMDAPPTVKPGPDGMYPQPLPGITKVV